MEINQINKTNISILILSLLFIFSGSFFYPGTKTLYILFSIIIFAFIYYSFFISNFYFFNFFLSIYFFLGFWLKLFFVEFFFNGKYPEINSDIIKLNEYNYDLTITIISISIFGFFLGSFISKKININVFKSINILPFDLFYQKYRISIILLFFVFIVGIYITNFFYSIHQKGIISEQNYFVTNLFKTFIVLLIPLIISVLAYHEIRLKKNLSYNFLFLINFDLFLSSVSTISRAMFFNFLGIFFGIFIFLKKFNIKNFYFKIFSFTLTAIILFLISFYIVNLSRDIKYQKKDFTSEVIINNYSQSKENFKHVILKRFVGIDGILALTTLNNLSFKTFKKSLKEKFNQKDVTFRDKLFNEKYTDNQILNNQSVYRIKTIGIVGFLYYSGSYFFVFFSSLLIGLFFCYLEKVIKKLFCDNLIFTSVISHIIVYRLIHFGYLPINSIKFFISIFLIIILFILFYKSYEKLNG